MIRYCLLNLLLFSNTLCFSQNRYDVVIDEIMADPSPVVGLPNTEWIELHNRSLSPIDLQGWRLGDENGISGPMPSIILQPDSFVIICNNSSLIAMSVYGKAAAITSFPSLDNNGETIYIKNRADQTVHAVRYSLDWYQNDLKRQGGWSLEMKDKNLPCVGADNWTASIAPAGGTPGGPNSVARTITDDKAPTVINSFVIDRYHLMLELDETIDSNMALNPASYSLEGLQVVNVKPVAPLFSRIELTVDPGLDSSRLYNLTISALKDCSGNTMIPQTGKIGIPVIAKPADIIINEILYNPRSSGTDFIEVYNRSRNIIDASQLFVANRNLTNSLNTIIPVFDSPLYFFPGEYLVITEDPPLLSREYFIKDIRSIIKISSMPSLPDDKGNIVLLNQHGVVIDELSYDDHWQFQLLTNTEGVSLERIDPDLPTQVQSNWHSAATSAGYATPGYRNSQYKIMDDVSAALEVDPLLFSPDNDGYNDFMSIRYQLPEPGYVGSIVIYDQMGRSVRSLIKNELLGTKGFWLWDGLNEKRQQLNAGAYIIVTELFNLQGRMKKFRNVVVLARKN